MYEIPAATSDIQRAPIRVVEYTPQFYAQADLDFFFSNFTLITKQKQLEGIDNVACAWLRIPPLLGVPQEADLELD